MFVRTSPQRRPARQLRLGHGRECVWSVLPPRERACPSASRVQPPWPPRLAARRRRGLFGQRATPFRGSVQHAYSRRCRAQLDDGNVPLGRSGVQRCRAVATLHRAVHARPCEEPPHGVHQIVPTRTPQFVSSSSARKAASMRAFATRPIIASVVKNRWLCATRQPNRARQQLCIKQR